MPATSTRSIASHSSPVVHLHQPREPQPPWQNLAIAGALALQFLLVALIAWKTLVPAPNADGAPDTKFAAALEKLDASLGVLDARRKAELADSRARARTEFLDEAFRELKRADDGAISRLQSRFDQSARLADDVAARDAEIREMRTFIEDARGKLQAMEVTARREEKRLAAQIDDLTTENGRLQADLKKEELISFNPKLNAKVASKPAANEANQGRASIWWWVAGGALAAVALVGGVWCFGNRGESPRAIAGKAAATPAEML